MSIFRPLLFANKIALVTGGGSGIGKAITEELYSLGATVIICSRNKERVHTAAEEIQEKYNHSNCDSDVVPLQCDIRSSDDVDATLQSIMNQYGKIDYLVNNAGGQFPSRVENITEKGWNAVIDTNLNGTFRMCKEVFTLFMSKQEEGGAIVNVIADMFSGFPMMAHTGAARAGVENLTKTMAIEWSEFGVRVNNVAPGVIYSQSAASNYDTPLFEMARPMLPTKRLGTPEEVSSSVCYLLSPGAAFINGATIRVDGASSLLSQSMREINEHERMKKYEWL